MPYIETSQDIKVELNATNRFRRNFSKHVCLRHNACRAEEL